MNHCLFTWDIGPLIFAIKKDTATHKAPINTTRKKKMFSNVINIIAEDHDFHLRETGNGFNYQIFLLSML